MDGRRICIEDESVRVPGAVAGPSVRGSGGGKFCPGVEYEVCIVLLRSDGDQHSSVGGHIISVEGQIYSG